MAANRPEVIVEGDVVYITRPGLAVYVKTADICRLIGKSNQWVGQLVSQGTLRKKKTPLTGSSPRAVTIASTRSFPTISRGYSGMSLTLGAWK